MSTPLGAQPLPPMTQPGLLGGGLQAFTSAWAGWFSTVQKILVATSSSGATSARPNATYVGQFFFDQTLNRPIWAKTIGASTVWIEAGGAVV